MGPAGWWLVAALALGIAELAAPGVFLVFLAVAAAITAAAVLALPDLSPVAQLVAFGLWSAIAVVVGRRWYADFPVSGDARLNDRAARMIGEEVVVETAIVDGRGRVRVGDGSWPARGADVGVGERVRIVSVESGVVCVEALGERA